MDAIALIADHDDCRRQYLRICFSRSGFLVATATNALELLNRATLLNPDVLVIADDVLRGECDGFLAQFVERMQLDRRPQVLVTGDLPAEQLSARTGSPVSHCFSVPIRKAETARRIWGELTMDLLCETA